MEAAACEIERLPEELLAAIISLTSPSPSPLDACRAAAVCQAFRAAADSDAVWSPFLPRVLPQLAEGELPCAPSKKALFRRLCDEPALLPCKLVSMWLDRVTGAKCYTFSARALHFSWGDTPGYYWAWINLGCDEVGRNKCFKEAAKLREVWWLEISAKIHSMMLSQNSTYATYMVFKLADDGFNQLDFPFREAIITVDSTRPVCFQNHTEVGDDGVPHLVSSWDMPLPTHRRRGTRLSHYIMLPRKRADGWMEVELAEFYNEESDDSVVSIGLTGITGLVWKNGLIVWGIEIRAKQ